MTLSGFVSFRFCVGSVLLYKPRGQRLSLYTEMVIKWERARYDCILETKSCKHWPPLTGRIPPKQSEGSCGKSSLNSFLKAKRNAPLIIFILQCSDTFRGDMTTE